MAQSAGLGCSTARQATGRGPADEFVPDLLDGPRLAPAGLRLPRGPQAFELLARDPRQPPRRGHGALPSRLRGDWVHLDLQPPNGLAVRRSLAHREQREPRAVDPRRLRPTGPSVSTSGDGTV